MNLNVNGKLPSESEIDEELSSMSPTCMTLIGEISRLMNSRLMAGEEKNSLLQKSSRLIMMSLAKRDAVTQLNLVRETHLKSTTISVTLQKLERDGYVERRPDNYDLRAIRVYLTEKGKDYNRYIVSRVRKEEVAVLQCLTEAENKQLFRLLARLREHMIDEREKSKF